MNTIQQVTPMIRAAFMTATLVCVMGMCVGAFADVGEQQHSPWVIDEPGDLPIIVLAPHGGAVQPRDMPVMPDAKGRDSNTDALARAIVEALSYTDANGTRHKPHLVINLLHRKYVDSNRSWSQNRHRGWIDHDGQPVALDPRAELNYRDFHACADQAVRAVQEQYGAGLLLDIHGLAARRKLDMYGYLVRSSDLHAPDDRNAPADDARLAKAVRERSTLREAASRKTSSHDIADLVRGPTSLASLVDAYYLKHDHAEGRPATPSARYPNPKAAGTLDADDPYFNGSYDIVAHSSRQPKVRVDAVQVETTWAVRRSQTSRRQFAEAMAAAVRQFLQVHYGLTPVD